MQTQEITILVDVSIYEDKARIKKFVEELYVKLGEERYRQYIEPETVTDWKIESVVRVDSLPSSDAAGPKEVIDLATNTLVALKLVVAFTGNFVEIPQQLKDFINTASDTASDVQTFANYADGVFRISKKSEDKEN